MGKRRRPWGSWWSKASIGSRATLSAAAIVTLTIAAGGLTALAINAHSNASPQPERTARTDFDFSQQDTRPLLAVIGDSWAAGAGSESGNAQAGMVRLAMRAADVPGQIFGEGGTGYTAESTWGPAFPDRLQPIIDMKPSAVLIQGSANDYSATEGELRGAAERTYDSLTSALPGVHIIVLGPMYSTAGDNDSVDDIRGTLKAAAEGRDLTFVDPVEQEWLPLDPAFYSDGYHPNAEGHRMIAARLTPILEGLPPRSAG